jgi:hypothetical protein
MRLVRVFEAGFGLHRYTRQSSAGNRVVSMKIDMDYTSFTSWPTYL